MTHFSGFGQVFNYVQQSHQGLHKQITITNEEFEDVEEDFSPGLFFLGHF
jgi:hypothetical protein